MHRYASYFSCNSLACYEIIENDFVLQNSYVSKDKILKQDQNILQWHDIKYSSSVFSVYFPIYICTSLVVNIMTCIVYPTQQK